MARSIYMLLSLAFTLWVVGSAAAQPGVAGLEKLKSLEGTWHGNNPQGNPVTVSYEVISGGTAVMETIAEGTKPGMVTIYHVDGDQLMLTHFCTMGNQPRMRANIPTGDLTSLEFKFVDVTNVSDHVSGHIRDLTVTFNNQDSITQVWTWRTEGKDVAGTFNLMRAKRSE